MLGSKTKRKREREGGVKERRVERGIESARENERRRMTLRRAGMDRGGFYERAQISSSSSRRIQRSTSMGAGNCRAGFAIVLDTGEEGGGSGRREKAVGHTNEAA